MVRNCKTGQGSSWTAVLAEVKEVGEGSEGEEEENYVQATKSTGFKNEIAVSKIETILCCFTADIFEILNGIVHRVTPFTI
jgi:hypothetical protein